MNKFKIAKSATSIALKAALQKVAVDRKAKSLARKIDDDDLRLIFLERQDHAAMVTVHELHRELLKYDPDLADALIDTFHEKRFDLTEKLYG